MWWWIGAIATWLFGFIGIIAVMSGVFRKKSSAWAKGTIMGYLIHGVFATAALWMFINAIA